MTETTRPQRIFRASDLSARCDRALARAALLARSWDSKLAVAYVVHAAEVAVHNRLSSGAPSWRRPKSWSQTPERALRADLAAQANESWRAAATQQCTSHLAEAALPAPVEAALHRVLEQGTCETLLSDHVASADVDVVVLGSRGRSGLARARLGSTAENLPHTLDCDTPDVRGA